MGTAKTIREPASGPMIDTNLVPDIADYIKRFVAAPSDDHALVMALWVLHTWVFEAAQATPYLYVYSDGPEAGKTRVIETLELLVRSPLRTSHVTPSALFRAIDTLSPTLLWDEVDTIYSGQRNEVMRNILDAGYRRGGYVLRIQHQQARKFNVFGPKLLAGIFNGFMPETIQSRSIPIKMAPKQPHQKVERLYITQQQNAPEREQLLARIELFQSLCLPALMYIRPEPIASISDRQWEIAEPLMSLASVFGAEERVSHALVEMFKETAKKPNLKQQLLAAVRQAFGGRDRIFTEDLVTALGPAWTAKTLSNWLAPYGINPRNMRIGNDQQKGYAASDFAALWGEDIEEAAVSEQEAV